MFGIKKELDALRKQTARLEAALWSSDRDGKQAIENLAKQVKALSAGTNRHDMAVEDLLDSWEELQNEQREERQALSGAFSTELEKQLAQSEKREAALLGLLMAYHDQLHGLRRAAERAGAEGWGRQLALAEEKLSGDCASLGLQTVQDGGVPVNYAIHEVVDTAAADGPERVGCVAEVYSCGYLYLGRTLRKAKVSAWKGAAPGTGEEENT